MARVLEFKGRDLIDSLPDDLMKVSEFVKKWGCDKSYPYKLRDRGKLKLYKIGTFKVSESEALRVMGSC